VNEVGQIVELVANGSVAEDAVFFAAFLLLRLAAAVDVFS